MRDLSVLCALALVAAAAAGCGDKDGSRTGSRTASVKDESDSKLTLVKPGPLTIRRGGTELLEVRIDRQNVPYDVKIVFGLLPKGVSVVNESDRITTDRMTYTVRASESASLVEKSIANVTATSSTGMSVTQEFEVNVRERETSSGR